jgi:hypothetical protein
MSRFLSLGLIASLIILNGCTSPSAKDYTEFRKHQPHSILVLPPLNESTEVIAGYSLLTTTTKPLSELGYYVCPVALADQFLKENGLPTAFEMHQAPLDKLHDVFNTDAVLYITVEKYGTKYHVISSDTVVFARAKLVDCASGINIWEGKVTYTNDGGNSGLLGAIIGQIANKISDTAHAAAAQASVILLTQPNQGLLKGPRHPEFGKPE